jgi:hypothetical protein
MMVTIKDFAQKLQEVSGLSFEKKTLQRQDIDKELAELPYKAAQFRAAEKTELAATNTPIDIIMAETARKQIVRPSDAKASDASADKAEATKKSRGLWRIIRDAFKEFVTQPIATAIKNRRSSANKKHAGSDFEEFANKGKSTSLYDREKTAVENIYSELPTASKPTNLANIEREPTLIDDKSRHK